MGLSVGAILVLYIAAMAGYLVYRRRKRRAGPQLIEDALMGKGRRTESSGGGRERQSRRKKEDKDGKEVRTEGLSSIRVTGQHLINDYAISDNDG